MSITEVTCRSSCRSPATSPGRWPRNPDDTWTLADHIDGAVPIGPLELELSMDEIYEGTDEAMARAAAQAAAPALPE